jgi:hypothetical protein
LWVLAAAAAFLAPYGLTWLLPAGLALLSERQMYMIDIDAARAARREKKREPHEIKVGGERFTVPHMRTWQVRYIEAFRTGETREVFKALMGDEDWARFEAHGFDLDDLEDLADGIAAEAGLQSVGKPSASGSSSPSNGRPSKPTSGGSTELTSVTSGAES